MAGGSQSGGPGLSVLMTQQSATHDNPIQLSKEISLGKGVGDSPDTPVPLVSTFLFKKEPPDDLPATTVIAEGDSPTAAPDGVPDADVLGPPSMSATQTLSRYALSLKVYQVATKPTGAFDFTDNLEQVGDWSDVLIVDVGSSAPGTPFGVWTGWNSDVAGSISAEPQMSEPLDLATGVVALPDVAKALPNLRIWCATEDNRDPSRPRISHSPGYSSLSSSIHQRTKDVIDDEHQDSHHRRIDHLGRQHRAGVPVHRQQHHLTRQAFSMSGSRLSRSGDRRRRCRRSCSRRRSRVCRSPTTRGRGWKPSNTARAATRSA